MFPFAEQKMIIVSHANKVIVVVVVVVVVVLMGCTGETLTSGRDLQVLHVQCELSCCRR